MGAGVRDAMNLSWKIAGVLTADLPEPVLDTYEVERKPHARAMIQLARLIGVSMTQGGRAGDLLRGAVAPRLHWVPGLRDRLLDGQTPPLRRSELVNDADCAGPSTDGCARTRSWRMTSGTTT